MERLEEELRKALQRQDPGEGFTQRVLRRAGEVRQRMPWWAGARLRWAAAAVLCVMLLSGWVYREGRRAQGEAARRQAITALQIAGAKLRLAQTKVQNLGQ
jgi:hypothetical protein